MTHSQLNGGIHHLAPAALAAAGCLAAFGARSLACGGTPPPRDCGKSLVIAQGLPGTVLLTGGGMLDVPLTAYLNLTAAAGGGTPCPPGPYVLMVTLTLTCPGMAPAVTTVTFPLPGPGYSAPLVASVPVPPGAPRVCALSVTGKVVFGNGTSISANSVDKDVCIGAPSPQNPAVPRLVIAHAVSPVVRAHPGDQASMKYVVTNNDTVNTFNGTVTVSMEGSARLVTSTGPAVEPAGSGPFTISDPTAGDNFPIAFGPVNPPLCVPLPASPQDPTVPMITNAVTLLPGQSKMIEVVGRSWGMCANGSCSKAKVRLEGVYSDSTSGLACTSSAMFADTSAPPQFKWVDSGKVATLTPTGATRLMLSGMPAATTNTTLGVTLSPQTVTFNGQPPIGGQQFLFALTPEYGRLMLTPQFPPQPLNVSSFFDVFVDVSLDGGSLQSLAVVPNAPNGYATIAPMLMGSAVSPGSNAALNSFFDIFVQVSADVVTTGGQVLPMQRQTVAVTPRGPTAVTIQQRWTPMPSAIGQTAVGLVSKSDVRGFSRPGRLLFCPGDVSGDGVVNFADLSVVLAQFGQTVTPATGGDVNGDGVVNFADLSVVLSQFGRVCGQSGT